MRCEFVREETDAWDENAGDGELNGHGKETITIPQGELLGRYNSKEHDGVGTRWANDRHSAVCSDRETFNCRQDDLHTARGIITTEVPLPKRQSFYLRTRVPSPNRIGDSNAV